MQRVKTIGVPSWDPKKEGTSPPPRRYRPPSATPPFLQPSLLCTPCTPLKCQAGSVRAEPGSGSLNQARRPPDPGGRRARISSVPSGPACPGLGALGDRARRAGSCNVPGANSDVAPSSLGSFFPQLQRGARPGGRLGGAVPSAQRGGAGGGLGEADGEGGRRARGWVGMDNQHLGRNSSCWFPPSVSLGSEMGPCEQEGGSERRVCARVRMGRRGRLFPPAKETQPRGNGAERIIKAGKRSWERRGGSWGGGFTRPGSYYTALGASFPRASPSIPQTPALRTWAPQPRAPPRRASG